VRLNPNFKLANPPRDDQDLFLCAVVVNENRGAEAHRSEHVPKSEAKRINMNNCKTIEMVIAIVCLLILPAVYVPTNAQTLEPRAAKVRIALRDRDIYGVVCYACGGDRDKGK
jgi:hypothetical protein